MIVTETVLIKLNSNNYSYYVSKGYIIPTHIDTKKRVKSYRRGSSILVKVSDLPPQSNVTIKAKCKECTTIRELKYCSYTDICWSCNLKQQKGVDHPKWLHNVKGTGAERKFDIYLRKKYNITAEFYYKEFAKQEYKCKICKKPQSEEGRKFAVDHSHKTGVFRGLLCQKCNTAIGLLKDNIDIIKSAYEYLKEHHV